MKLKRGLSSREPRRLAAGGARRGRPTANAEFGNAASVLVGDFLYSRAFQMMVRLERMRILEVLSDATNMIAEGEVLQLLHCRNPDIDERRYLDVVRRKTAKLFEASMRLGAILAGVEPALEDALSDYGMHLGTAFQLIDDVLDYSGDATVIGKNLGDDLAEGKATLPLIRAMTMGTKEQSAAVRHAIVEGGIGDFALIHETIEATGALAKMETLLSRLCIKMGVLNLWKKPRSLANERPPGCWR